MIFSVFKLFSFFVILALTLLGPFTLCCKAGENMSESFLAPTEKDGHGVSLRVLWTVSSFYITNNSTWGEDEARAMLFKPLDIGETFITFDGQTCREVFFTSETVDMAEYLMERYQVTPQILGLEEKTVKVVKTTCSLPGFNEYAPLSDRRLLVSIQGILFFFTPAVNY